MVDYAEVDALGDDVLAYAFSKVGVDLALIDLACFVIGLEGRPVGVHSPHFDVRILLFQIAGCATYGAARTHAHHQMGYLAFGLFPYLWARLLVVSLHVAQVVILIGIERVGYLLIQPTRYRVVGP